MTFYKWSSNVTLLVEFGFGSGPLATAPAWTDIAAYGLALSTERGRQSVRSSFDAGTLTLELDNITGRFDPNNSSSPYYPNMRIGTPVRIRATHNAVTYPIWRGAVTRWPVSYPLEGHDSIVTIEAVENLAILNRTLISTALASVEGDDRIDDVLDAAGWPAAWRDLSIGAVLLAAQDFDGVALEAIQAAVDAEVGTFYIARDGDATFRNRLHFSGGVSAATFNVAGGLEYGEVRPAYDADLLINHAIITAGDGGIGEDSDPTSIAALGPGLPYTATIEPLISSVYAQNTAEWLVERYKDVSTRIVGLGIHPEQDPANLFPEILGRELQDLVTVVVNPPGTGSNLSQLVGVEGIRHDITPEAWDTVYTCHPRAAIELQNDFWILGVSDDLGVDTRLA